MIFVLIGIVIAYALAFVTYEQMFSRTAKMASKIPGPNPVFLAGNAFEFGRNPVEFFKEMSQAVMDYGGIVRFWLGTSLYVLISNTEDIEFILRSNSILKKGDAYDYLHGWLGSGLVTADGGPKWHAHRKLLTPAFHFKILEEFINVFNKNSNILMKKLKSEVGKPVFDVEPYVSDCTLDIICETAMGSSLNAQLDSESTFAKAVKDVSSAVMYRSFKPWLFPKFLFNISSTGRLHNSSLKYVHDFVHQVIQKKKKLHEESNFENEKYLKFDEYGCCRKYAFLDLMLLYRDADSSTLSDKDIHDEVNTFMFAGHDTTTAAISFTIYVLANHQKIQEEVVSELTQIFGDSERDATYQDLQNMKYLERVIKESMRLYTPVPLIVRKATHDVMLPSGYTVPEGSSITLFLYKMHHNSKLFSNPEEFNPDNFLPEKMQGRPPFAYCPFSAGPRNCIGQKFAMLEMKSTLSCILRKYELLPPEHGPEVLLSAELILRSATGVNIQIKNRIW